jgi:hypothetical protein
MLIEPSPRNLDFPIELKYNATTLLKAGVKFVVVDNNHLLDIRFDNGVLKIPRLVTGNIFECTIRNIIWPGSSSITIQMQLTYAITCQD